MRLRPALAGLAILALAGCGSDSGTTTGSAAAPPAGGTSSVPTRAIGDLHGCGFRPILAKFRCGSIHTPFVRGDPSLGTAHIAFAVRPAPQAAKDATPIFAVEGGPGYGSTRTEPAYANLFRGLMKTHELVLVDMRGTGRSGGLNCPDVQSGLGPEWITLGECARRLGPRVDGFTTAMAADDINDVRVALGFSKIALYGDSYGTFLGQSYAFRHPETLSALVLDSAYPARGESAWYPSLPKTGIRSYSVACSRAPSCPPHPAKRLAKLANHLRSTGRGVEPLIDAIGAAAYGAPGSYLAIDRAGRALLAGNSRPWEDLTYNGLAGVKQPHHYSHTDELVVGCNDYPMIWRKDASPDQRRAQLEHAIRAYPHHAFEPFTPREIAYSPYLGYLECITWPRPSSNYEPPIPKGAEPTHAPVLVVSGELDDTTTAAEGRLVAREFPDSRQYIAPNAGHVASLYDGSSPPARRIRAFLRAKLSR